MSRLGMDAIPEPIARKTMVCVRWNMGLLVDEWANGLHVAALGQHRPPSFLPQPQKVLYNAPSVLK